MTLSRQFPIWRYAADGIEPQRTMGGPVSVRHGEVTITGPGRTTWKTAVTRWLGLDYYDIPLSLDSFAAALEGYALDVACPCGEQLAADNAGDLLREIYKHCGSAGHPFPHFDR